MTVLIYDPSQVDVIIGTFPPTGWADGDFVKFETDTNLYEFVKGTDGVYTRTRVEGISGLLTLMLMQTSKANDYFSALANGDILVPGGSGIVPSVIKDRGGTSLLAAPDSWVEKFPGVTYGKAASAREWPIRCVNVTIFIGGN